MKHQTTFATLALLAALVIPGQTTAQGAQQEGKPHHHKYRLIDLGTFGGPQGFINPTGNGDPYINNVGDTVANAQTAIPLPPDSNGVLCLPGTYVNHALRRHGHQITDLGALSPSDQNCSNALGINDRGEIAGQSENGVIDPLLGVIEARAVVWKDRKIIDLGTFGGNHSAAMFHQLNADSRVFMAEWEKTRLGNLGRTRYVRCLRECEGSGIRCVVHEFDPESDDRTGHHGSVSMGKRQDD